MLNAVINIEAKNASELIYALEEAKRRIENGNTSGSEGNQDSNFNFQIEGDEEENEGDAAWYLRKHSNKMSEAIKKATQT